MKASAAIEVENLQLDPSAEGMEYAPVQRLSKDLLTASYLLSDREARYLVDQYYTMQEYRKRSANQVRVMTVSEEPNALINWFAAQASGLELQVLRALKRYAECKPIGRWALSICGIGPVITAGLLAHIDIQRALTASHIWRFAGLDPTIEWSKGEKRPWNGALKTLCWKIGESFVKVSTNKSDFYGAIWREQKERIAALNEKGFYADQCAEILEKRRFGKTTEAYGHYSAGRLPPAHVHARAKRYAVKLFLSHLYEVWRTLEGLPIEKPFAIGRLKHNPDHYIAPPNRDKAIIRPGER